MDVDDVFTSEIDVVQDTDYIRVSLAGGFAHSLTVETTSAVLDLHVELRDAADQRIFSYAASDGSSVLVPFNLNLSGNYFVVVSDSSGNDVGEYTISFDNDDAILGSVLTAASMDVGDVFTSEIDVVQDTDYVRVSLEAGFAHSMTVDTTSDVLDLRVELRDAADQRIFSYASSNGASVFVPFSLFLSGNYFVVVSDSSGNDVGDYTITFDNDDTILGSVFTAASMDVDEVFTSEIDVVQDIDFVRVSLEAGFAQSLTVDTTSDVLDLRVELRDAADQRIFSYAATDGAPIFVPFNLSLSGDYFVVVSDSSANDVGDYTITFDNDDVILGSLATTAEMAPGDTFSSEIDVLQDVDYVRTELPAGLTYGYSVSTTSADLDLRLQLRNAADQNVFSVSASDGATATVAHTLALAGEYYLVVSDANGNDVGAYTIEIDNDDVIVNSVDTTTSMQVGRCLIPEIDVVSDVDYVAINLVAGSSYDFILTTRSDVLDLRFSLHNGLDSWLVSDSALDGDGVGFVYTATYTGTHYMRVADSSSNDIGEYMILVTGDGDGILNGDNNGNELHGGGGNDVLIGEAGQDIMVGGDDDDRLVGGADSDTLTGGDGEDTFVFDQVTDDDLITDFQALDDLLDISALIRSIDCVELVLFGFGADPEGEVIATFGGRMNGASRKVSVHLAQSGDDVIIDIESSAPVVGPQALSIDARITLENILATELTVDNFVFG